MGKIYYYAHITALPDGKYKIIETAEGNWEKGDTFTIKNKKVSECKEIKGKELRTHYYKIEKIESEKKNGII